MFSWRNQKKNSEFLALYVLGLSKISFTLRKKYYYFYHSMTTHIIFLFFFLLQLLCNYMHHPDQDLSGLKFPILEPETGFCTRDV